MILIFQAKRLFVCLKNYESLYIYSFLDYIRTHFVIIISMKNSKYFDGEISGAFVSLLTGRMFMFTASGLMGLFLPIFLFNLFDKNYLMVFGFYGLASFLYVLFLPWGIKVADQKIGLQRSLRLSLLFLALFYVSTYLVERETIFIFMPLAIIFMTLFRTLFWTPFRTDISKFTNKKNRGRQMSSFEAINMSLAVILPIIAAFILNRFGFDVLFILAIAIYLLTIIPFRMLPPTKEDFSWGYLETFKHFFKSLKKKKATRAFVAEGVETFAALIIWPIFIYELLNGDFMKVGIVSSLIILITVVLQLSLGKHIDRKLSKGSLLRWGSAFYALGWIVKIFILTAFHVFIAGAYHSITKIFTSTPYNTLVYDLSANEGHYVDEYSAIMEMSIHTGRFVMFGIGLILINWIGITSMFVIAALASLALNFINEQDLYFTKD